MKVLITGAGGQLGYDLIRVLSGSHQVIAMTRAELDVADEAAVNTTFRQMKPQVVIHAAAYTNVDLAEQESDNAYTINSIGTRNVAMAAEELGAKLVHISTDYVFDGSKRTPYTETDRPNPLGVYGNSKLHAEKFVELISGQYFILRTSWLYGKNGSNFVTKMISLGQQKEELSVVADQFGSPTYTLDLARFIEHLMLTDRYGLYHVSNRGYCSRYAFAQAIFQALKWNHIRLVPISSSGFPAAAQRPEYSVFDDTAIRLNQLPRLRNWKDALNDFLHNDYVLEDKGDD
ncbi:dTDP-4-dehydrorhamnose reductase [Paenibacillus sp. UNC451MF]|uniref:dTDP-4-dehydrorhamnose reductase n=1 Tax=Paenibacillus sp. UNC451MF TaxID=1449063 RepID=UPI000491AE95|nr:dTDP-4-dehydrorhamnose reductase [Paenibacillus sp. UNC451MF]